MNPTQSIYRIGPTGDAHSTKLTDIETRSLGTVRIGESAGAISAGVNNVFTGVEAGKLNSIGSYQTMIGYQAGYYNRDGSYSVGIGAYALAQNQSGQENVHIGFRAGEYHQSGSRVVSIGAFSGRYNYSGDGNVNVGYASGERNIEGNYNTWVGTESGQDNRAGSFNAAIGYQAGRANYLGNENVYVGAYSGACNALGDANVFLGYSSGQYNQNGSFNTFVGSYTGQNATNGSANTAVGYGAGENNTSGSSNTWLGVGAGQNNLNANNNVFVGTEAGKNIEGDGNTMVGYRTGNAITNGSNNVFIGIGANAYIPIINNSITIGSYGVYGSTDSIAIGSYITDKRYNNTLIGSQISVDATNAIIIGDRLTINDINVFRDPLFYTYLTAVESDGLNKFGLIITPYTYSNTLISPSNDIYPYATAQLFTSNLANTSIYPTSINSITNYSLLTSRNYVVQQGSVYPKLFDSYVIPNNIESTIKYNIPALQIITDNLTNNILFHNFKSQFNYYTAVDYVIPLTNVFTNVYNINSSGSIYPIVIPKLAKSYQMNFTNSNVIVNNRTMSYTINSATWNASSVSYIDGTGITIPLTNIYPAYWINQVPSFGYLNHSVYNSNCTNIIYTPFIESLNTNIDTFTINPVSEIIDGNNLIYGLPATNSSTIQIVVSSNTILPANKKIFSSYRSTTTTNITVPFDKNDLFIAPFDLSSNDYIKITSNDSALSVLINNIPYTSSIPVFQYSDILQNRIKFFIANNITSLQPTYLRVYNNSYSSNISIANTVLTDSVSFASNLIVHYDTFILNPIYLLTQYTYKILLKPPTNGILTNLLSRSIASTSYELIDPYALYDEFVIGNTNNTGNPNNTLLYNVYPPEDTNVHTVYVHSSNIGINTVYALSNQIGLIIQGTNRIYNTFITSNNGVVTINNEPLIDYNASFGYCNITSNINTFAPTSNWNTVIGQCNIYRIYNSSNYIYNGSIIADQWITTNTYSGVSFSENSNYTYLTNYRVYTSNLFANNTLNYYLTSNAVVNETWIKSGKFRQDYTGINVNQYLSNISVPTQSGYGFNSNIRINIKVEKHNVNYYNDFLLNRNHLFTRSSNSIQYTFSNIIFTKYGLNVNTFTQQDINNEIILGLIPINTTPYDFNISSGSIVLPISVSTPRTFGSNNSALTLSLGTGVSIGLNTIITEGTGYTYVVIERIQYGSINPNVTRLLISSISSYNYFISYKYLSDNITYYFTNLDNTLTSDTYTKYLLFNRNGMPYGQSVNGSIDPTNNILDASVFNIVRSGSQINSITITVLPTNASIYNDNVIVSVGNNILYSDIVAGKVRFVPISFSDIVLDSFQYTVNGIGSPISYPLTLFHQTLFPYILEDTLIISRLGTDGYKNTLTNALGLHLANVANQTNVSFNILNHPSNGVLLNSNIGQIANRFTLGDINSNVLRYIPFNPRISEMANDSMTIQIAYDSIISGVYTIPIKNYIAPYTSIVVDTTKVYGRYPDVSTLPISKGLVDDGYSWRAPNQVTSKLTYPLANTCNVSIELYNTTYNVNAEVFAYSERPVFNTTEITLNVTQSDYVTLPDITALVTNGIYRDLVFYLVQPPINGILEYITGTPATVFIYSDVIFYQHLGSSTTNDVFYLQVSSTPYDISSVSLKVNVIVNALPIIYNNPDHYYYHNTISSALNSYHTLKPFELQYSSEADIYINIISKTNVDIQTISNESSVNTFTYNDILSDTVGVKLLSYGINDAYGMVFNVNSSSNINRLASYPEYQSVFYFNYDIYLNQTSNINKVLGTTSLNQNILYNFDVTNANYTNIRDNDSNISLSLYLNPNQPIIYNSLTLNSNIYQDWTTINNNLKDLSTYQFALRVIDINDRDILNINFTDKNISVNNHIYSDVPLPSSTFSKVNYVNRDINNYAALNITYDYVNTPITINILEGLNFSTISFSEVKTIGIYVDLGDSSNVFNQPTIVSEIPYNIDIQNYGNQYLFDSFELNVLRSSTCNIADSYNIVVGKTIQVEGANNICMGTNFNTTGDNSVILGNNMGTKTTGGLLTTNDIYKSILIGNDFFTNASFIRDTICIGNTILTNTFGATTEQLNNFFSAQPILIGNQISSIRYQINIGNIFLKSIYTDINNLYRILVGVDTDAVGIGYKDDTDVLWKSGYRLSVNGNINATNMTLDNTLNTNALIANNIQTNTLNVLGLATSNTIVEDSFITSNALIYKTLITTNLNVLSSSITNNAISSNLNVINNLFASNVEINGSFTYKSPYTIQTPMQARPINNVFISSNLQTSFVLGATGIYTGSASNVEVYYNGSKLAWYASNTTDYELSVVYYPLITKTEFIVILSDPVAAGDIVDITVWPTFKEYSIMQPSYLYQQINFASQWSVNGNNIFISGYNVGIGSTIPQSTLDVNGPIKNKNPYILIHGSGGAVSHNIGDTVKFNLEYNNNYSGSYNTSTYSYTLPITGTYLIQCSIYVTLSTSTNRIYLYVNGGSKCILFGIPAGTSDVEYSGSTVLKLNATDVISFVTNVAGTYYLAGSEPYYSMATITCLG